MNSYSIQFIAKPQKGKRRTWELSQCSDMDKVQERLRRVRQLVTIITGSSSDILSELTDWGNIAQSCNPTWRRSINIADPRAYTFLINLSNKQALITAKSQGRPLRKIGLPKAIDMESYQKVISFMYIFIRLLEGINSPNEEWVKDMSVGRINLEQSDDSILSLFQKLQVYPQKMDLRKDCSSLYTSHPPEITIAVPASSYEIVITKQ